MTSRRTGVVGLAIAGVILVLSMVTACDEGDTSTTVPSMSTTTVPFVTTTVPSVPSTTVPPTTTTTTRPVTTTTLPPVTTTQSSTTTTSHPTTTKPPLPTITGLSPKTGPTAGGTSVVITGTGFTGLSGAGAVTFGGTAATSYTVNSATKITAKAPAHAAGIAQVKVTTANGSSANTSADDYTYLAAPTITGLSPRTGPTTGGTSVVITGTGFTGLSGANAVTFGGTAATSYKVDSATKITAKAPAHAAGSVQVKVTTANGSSANTSADDYTYGTPPTVTALSPKTGPTAGGTSVAITGTGFTNVTRVLFGDVEATFTVDSSTKITAKAPAHGAGAVQVKVTTASGSSANSAADDYTYLAAPTITGLAPTSGPTAGGTSVAITGTGFTDVTKVLFGDVEAEFTVDSPTDITAIAPPGNEGTVQLKVITTYGISADGAGDEYTYVAPLAVTGLAPTGGPVAGGTSVAITGTGFTDVTKVLFGDVEAKFTVDSTTSIAAIAPPGSQGTVQVKVITAYGTSTDTPADDYTYSAVGLWGRVAELFRELFSQ